MWPHEIRELLRMALIGGGLRPAAAEIQLHHHFDKHGLGELSLIAVQILNAAFMDDAPAEKKSPDESASAATPDGSTPEQFYGNGIIIGLDPRTIDNLTVSEFFALMDHWNDAHDNQTARRCRRMSLMISSHAKARCIKWPILS